MASAKLLLFAALIVLMAVNCSGGILEAIISPIIETAVGVLDPGTNSIQVTNETPEKQDRYEEKNRQLSASSLKAVAG